MAMKFPCSIQNPYIICMAARLNYNPAVHMYIAEKVVVVVVCSSLYIILYIAPHN